MPNPKRKCDGPKCSKSFVPRSKVNRFHSAACGKEWERIDRLVPAGAPRACQHCGEEFQPGRGNQKFCSVAHAATTANAARYDASARSGTPLAARAVKQAHPQGWEPGVIYDGAKKQGTITTKPTDQQAPIWEEQLREWGFDPEVYMVDLSTVNLRTWDALIPIYGEVDGKSVRVDSQVRKMWYHKANIVPRSGSETLDVADILAQIARHKGPKTYTQQTKDGTTLVVNLADWQVGKRDGDGTEGIIKRILDLVSSIPARIKELAKMGVTITRIILAGLGDLFENCAGHYAMQTFSVELDRRGQMNVVRRCLIKIIEPLAKMGIPITVVCVGGNHGENRMDGKAFTTFGDNDDVAVFEQVADILAANPKAYGHVGFVIPNNDLTLTLEVQGHVIGWAHGHQATKGAPLAALQAWRKDMADNGHPMGDATILNFGHRHHLLVHQDGLKTIFQCPTLDGGSQWFEERGGARSRPGTLCYTVDAAGWGNLSLL